MARLEDDPADVLYDALGEATGKKVTLPLLAAILYMQGPSGPTIADWFDVRIATVYGWFDRLEAEPIENAIRDESLPDAAEVDGRGAAVFRAGDAGTAVELRVRGRRVDGRRRPRFLLDEFDAEYTRRHARRSLAETKPS